jgi:Dos2-interacting transcription regulator of RNA-Pol-II
MNLIELTGLLQPYLTNANLDSYRARAVNLYSEILRKLPNLVLTMMEIETLLTFFIQKLKDLACTNGASSSIMALFEMQIFLPRVLPEYRIKFFRSITTLLGEDSKFNLPTYTQLVRYSFLRVLLLVFERDLDKELIDSEITFIVILLRNTE